MLGRTVLTLVCAFNTLLLSGGIIQGERAPVTHAASLLASPLTMPPDGGPPSLGITPVSAHLTFASMLAMAFPCTPLSRATPTTGWGPLHT